MNLKVTQIIILIINVLISVILNDSYVRIQLKEKRFLKSILINCLTQLNSNDGAKKHVLLLFYLCGLLCK